MIDDSARLTLPDRPSEMADDAVAAWSEPVEIRTYEAGEPERLPAYLDLRVYQGSSGTVLPMSVVESVSHEPHVRAWQAVHLENEYVRLMVLPELGGRIHVGYDKVTGQDFFYRNNTIKPALVGLAGPWVSGGVEFNWPQHHRPATYLPTDWHIEHEADGSVTVWCSDHDPFARMKGMHGIRLRPGSAVVEARVRLFNRTAVTQTFLWWANVAARVHDDYQSFFPTDVHMVADHAKRAVTAFPVADRPYYGIDYPARADATSPGYVGPDADRIDWYRNIPVPTSYMCVGSSDDFFGGYDHSTGLGFVHVADHHIAPGKKQWTWGDAPFGHAWDDNLTDGDGPYVELMAGVYTDNQPDFTYLAPGETKTFSQFWYPIYDIGAAHQATTDAAASLAEVFDADGRTVRLGISAPRALDAQVELHDASGAVLWSTSVTVRPGASFTTQVAAPGDGPVTLVVREGTAEVLTCSTALREGVGEVEAATELPAPQDIESADELYLAGVHLAQYRHATRAAEPYWAELLRRDPLDSRANVAVAGLRLRDGRLDDAERHLRDAIARSTRRNPNPPTGEAHYLLGLVLEAQGRDPEAYDALSKSLWNAECRTAAHVALARLDARAQRWTAALDHARAALRTDTDHLQARAVAAVALRHLGRAAEADELLDEAASLDPLDAWTRDLRGDTGDTDAFTLVDVAAEYRSVGLRDDALRVLALALDAAARRPVPAAGNPVPLVHYVRAELLAEAGRDDEARAALDAARTCDAARSYPHGSHDARVLERALVRDEADARAHSLLGRWLYGQRRHTEAVAHLRRAVELDPHDVVALRGLGLAAYNVEHDAAAASGWYERALLADPTDARLLLEADQLARRTATAPAQRLERLEEHPGLVDLRDDLTIALCELLVLVGREDEAVTRMSSRRFSPWEGGEGETLRVWSLAQSTIAARALDQGRPEGAVAALGSALSPPANLGEARHPLANDADLRLAYGDAVAAAGDLDRARHAWESAAHQVGDFTTMAAVPYSTATYFSVLAARRLGDEHTASALVDGLRGYVQQERETRPTIDYFATSLPTMLTFHEDLDDVHGRLLDVLDAQVALLEGRGTDAAATLGSLAERDPGDPLVHVLRTTLLARRAG